MTHPHDDETRSRAARPSRHAAGRHLGELRDVIETLRAGDAPRMESRAWPSGLDRSILHLLPLKLRTRNSLLDACFIVGDDPATVEQLLSIPSFGQTSLRELLLTVEDFLNQCVAAAGTDLNQADELAERVGAWQQATLVPQTGAKPSSTQWEQVTRILSPALAAAVELHEVETLADVLSPRFMKLADSMGVAEAIGKVRIADVTGSSTPGVVAATLNRLARYLDGASAAERFILEQRLLRTPRPTLEETGLQLGVTRERVRQLQARIEEKIQKILLKEGRVIASALQERLASVVPQEEMDRQLDRVISTKLDLASRFLRSTLIAEMGFTLDAGMYLDRPATQQLEQILASAHRLSDDVGLLDEQRFIENLPSEQWQRSWPWVRKRCGFHDLFGLLAMRDSGKARAKAALLSIGRPATVDEIARLCGLEAKKIRSHLSVIPSVVKADKDRWGLEGWIDDVYKGIAEEIIQRIDEDGGATTTARLLQELPDKFGVNPLSVRASMQTQKFVIRDGRICIASPALIQLRDLDAVIDGRDQDGAPYWTFTVKDRFFHGYSVSGVPPEFAKALGCPADGGERIRVDNLPNCPKMSVRWSLTSMTGASIGYLSEPLKRLGLKPGQRARVTIKGPGHIELRADEGKS